MAGLLDQLDDPKTAGLLSLGLRLMSTPGNFGQALGQSGLGALGDLQAMRQQQERRKLQEQQNQSQALQMQLMQQQLAEAQRATAEREQQTKFLRNLPDPTQAALSDGGGPTMANAAKVNPTLAAMFRGVQAGVIPLQSYLAATQKDETPITLGEGGMLVTRDGRKIASNPKAVDLPSSVREYQFAQGQGFNGSLQDFITQQKRAGASNVSVSMDKGFGEAFAKDAAGALATSRDQARAAATTIQTIDRINGVLDSGKVALGPTSKFETFARQLAESAGIGGKDNAEKLANTRKVIQGAAALAVDGAAALKGQGQITEGERALVSRAAGGDVDSLTAPEIRALTGVLRKVNEQRISQHQQQLGNVGKQFQPFVPFYQVESPKAPASVDDLVRKYLGGG